jgi:hypothetical protein
MVIYLLHAELGGYDKIESSVGVGGGYYQRTTPQIEKIEKDLLSDLSTT